MKRGLTISWILFLLCTFLTQANVLMAQGIKRNNLVRNPGFEEGSSSWSLKNAAKIVSTEAHSGKNSLYYANPNPGTYNLFTQGIPVRPGQKLFFRIWVKGKGITTTKLGEAKGAGLYIQGYDANNNYIKGAFPFCLIGTFDWREIKGIYVVPEQVTRITVGLYMRRYTTGTVWFDDVAVQEVASPIFKAFLKYPNYRGMTSVNEKQPWEIQIIPQLPEKWKGGNLQSSIFNDQNRTFDKKEVSLKNISSPLTRSWKPPQNLKEGKYNWHFELSASNGNKILDSTLPIQVVKKMPAVYIDKDGFTMVKGKRFFPLGVYLGGSPGKGSWASSSENLNRIARAGFNTILSYYYGNRKDAADYLKSAEAHNLSVIYNLADIYDGAPNYTNLHTPASQTASRLINELKDNPNLLAWYTVDELGSENIVPVEERYQQIRRLDPDHPVFQVNNKPEALPLFYNSTDVMGSDPYPVAGAHFTSLSQVSSWTEKTVQAGEHIKPVWEVIQIFDKNFAKSDLASNPPTVEEMRNMSFQALINGAKGLMYYAYHWLFWGRDNKDKKIYSEADFKKRWPDIVKMIGEVKEVIPYILYGHPVSLSTISTSTVQYKAWQYENRLILVLSNPANGQKSLSLKIPQEWNLDSDRLKDIKTQFQDHKLQLQFLPFSSGALIFKK